MTSIEWTRNVDGSEGKSWNPIRGCSRVSDGCQNCYAMNFAHRFSGAGKPFERLTAIRRGKVDWAGHARFIPEQLGAPLRWQKPQRIFVNSMSDLFHESLSNEEIAAVFGVMAACPQHTFQVLTKRPERAADWFSSIEQKVSSIQEGLGPPPTRPRSHWFMTETIGHAEDVLKRQLLPHDFADTITGQWPLKNVWLGVSVEDQETTDERIPMLLQCPAAIRFVSYEPALGPVDFSVYLREHACDEWPRERNRGVEGCAGHPHPPINWIIVGGESGPGARPFDLAWARSVVKQCREAGAACFVKQFGAMPYEVVKDEARVNGTTVPWAKIVPDDDSHVMSGIGLRDKKGGDMSEWPDDLRVRQFPEVRRG